MDPLTTKKRIFARGKGGKMGGTQERTVMKLINRLKGKKVRWKSEKQERSQYQCDKIPTADVKGEP